MGSKKKGNGATVADETQTLDHAQQVQALVAELAQAEPATAGKLTGLLALLKRFGPALPGLLDAINALLGTIAPKA